MPPLAGAAGNKSLSARALDLVLPIGLITAVLVILVPLPSALLDVFLALNISVAVIMLLTTIYVRTPLEFSVFPSLSRAVLSVAILAS